jgi:CHRD domain
MTLSRALVAGFLLAGSAFASTLTFTLDLSSANEVPPNTSTGTGAATIVLNTVAQTLSVNITFSGLTSGTTGAHIHCCTLLPTTMNIGVATTVPAFPGFPLGVTSGTYSDTLDLTSSASYNPTFVTMEGGLSQAEAALIAGIENNETYLNIHTVNNGGGEIRAPLLSTPEPGTTLLAAAALAGLLLRRWVHPQRDKS